MANCQSKRPDQTDGTNEKGLNFSVKIHHESKNHGKSGAKYIFLDFMPLTQ